MRTSGDVSLASNSIEPRRPPELLPSVGDELHRRRADVQAPEVLRDVTQDPALVRHQVGVEGAAGFEGVGMQDALAETVDGKDGRLVEIHQRLPDPRGRLLRWRFGGNAVPGAGGKRPAGFQQALVNALAQLGRGRLGEGHRQDLLHRDVLLENEPDEKALDRIRFAGAGSRLDQVAPFQRDTVCVECVHGGFIFPLIR